MSRHDARAADEALAGVRPPPIKIDRRTVERNLRARMADVITRTLSMNHNVTESDLLGAGFEKAAIGRHFRGALADAGAERMAT